MLFLTGAVQAQVGQVPLQISRATSAEPLGRGMLIAENVMAHNGEFVFSVEILNCPVESNIEGIVAGTTAVLYYRSQSEGAGPLGPGWALSLMKRMVSESSTEISYYPGNGRTVLYTGIAGASSFEPPQTSTLKGTLGIDVN